jgi:phage-related baseplate assembly protein
MIKAKLTGFETAATTLTLAMSRENWNEYVSEKISLGDDCTISFGLPVDALTGITEHEKLESAIAEINRLKEILSMHCNMTKTEAQHQRSAEPSNTHS